MNSRLIESGFQFSPFILGLFRFYNLGFVLCLCGISKLFEGLGIHFHVAPHDAVCDSGDSLIPMSLLRALH